MILVNGSVEEIEEEAIRHGAAAAALTVQSRHAVNENLTPDLLNEALALVPAARILH